MDKVKQNVVYKCIVGCLLLISLVTQVSALDNPDTPDLVGEFEQRETSYLSAIANPNNSSREFLVVYNDYLIFLDKELNKAYSEIKSKLPTDRKQELLTAQRQWIKYRDAEFELIKNTWTRENFGSSAGISRGDYRSSIVRARVLQLFFNAKNF